MEMKQCPNCGKALHPDANFCPACMHRLTLGQEIPAAAAERSGSRHMGLFLLCAAALAAVIAAVLFAALGGLPREKAVVVWTMQLRPNGGVDSFAFCMEQDIVGFGWGLEGTPETVSEYRALRTQEGAYPGDTLLNATLDSFENMTAADYVNLVWVRDADGYYYICEITGPYQYSRDDSHERAGIVNFAACTFYRVGFVELVPQPVLNKLEGDGVIQCVLDVGATQETRQLWEMLKK